MSVRIQNGFFAHDGNINPYFLGGFPYFLKLISVFPDLEDGLGTSGSVLKLYVPFLGLLEGFPTKFGLEIPFSTFSTFGQYLTTCGYLFRGFGFISHDTRG